MRANSEIHKSTAMVGSTLSTVDFMLENGIMTSGMAKVPYSIKVERLSKGFIKMAK